MPQRFHLCGDLSVVTCRLDTCNLSLAARAICPLYTCNLSPRACDLSPRMCAICPLPNVQSVPKKNREAPWYKGFWGATSYLQLILQLRKKREDKQRVLALMRTAEVANQEKAPRERVPKKDSLGGRPGGPAPRTQKSLE